MAAPTEDAPRRQAILDAALELFAERGFHGTQVPLIAARAAVGAGTVYRYFPSKEALVNILYQSWKERLAEGLQGGLPARQRPRERFHQLWRRLGEFALRHPLALVFLELHHHGAYLDERSRAVESRALAPLGQLVAQARRKRMIRTLPAEVAVAMIYGAFVGLARASWEGRLRLTPEVLDRTERRLWTAIAH
jgi:AcrR family transcriptional regulator